MDYQSVKQYSKDDALRSYRFFLLGPFYITHQGNEITPKSQKTCAMLAMLCLSPRATRTRVWLRDKLWSDRSEDQGSASLRQALLDARRCLASVDDDILIADKKSISLNLERVNIDVDACLQGDFDLSNVVREDLLEGMDIRDPEFEDWLTLERQIWERKANSIIQSQTDRSTVNNNSRVSSSLTANQRESYVATIVAIHYVDQFDPDCFSFDECLVFIRENLENRGGRIYSVGKHTIYIEFARAIDAVNFSVSLGKEINSSFPLSFGICTGLVNQHGNTIIGPEVDRAVQASNLAALREVVVTEAITKSLLGTTAFSFDELPGGDSGLFSLATKRVMPMVETDKQATVSRPNYRGPTGPSIAVLPFRLAQRSSQDYVGEGLADDVIMALSHNHWLSVISRNSSFNCDTEVDNIGDIATQLGADYIVSGALKLDKSSVHIDITLENGATNQIVYSEPFSLELKDIMQLQELVATRITSRLLRELGKSEQILACESRIDDLRTWQLVHRGNWHMSRRTANGVQRARSLYENALKLDPFQTDALLALAWWYFWHGWSHHGNQEALVAFDESQRHCRKALLMDASDGRTHCYLGVIAIMRQKPMAALDSLNEAIRLNNSLSFAHASRGSANLLLAKPDLAVDDLHTGLALNPADAYRFHTLAELASANFFAGNLDEAIEAADGSIFLAPRYWYAQLIKIASLMKRNGPGDRAAAIAEKEQLAIHSPRLKVNNINVIPFENKEYNRALIEAFEKD